MIRLYVTAIASDSVILTVLMLALIVAIVGLGPVGGGIRSSYDLDMGVRVASHPPLPRHRHLHLHLHHWD